MVIFWSVDEFDSSSCRFPALKIQRFSLFYGLCLNRSFRLVNSSFPARSAYSNLREHLANKRPLGSTLVFKSICQFPYRPLVHFGFMQDWGRCGPCPKRHRDPRPPTTRSRPFELIYVGSISGVWLHGKRVFFTVTENLLSWLARLQKWARLSNGGPCVTPYQRFGALRHSEAAFFIAKC